MAAWKKIIGNALRTAVEQTVRSSLQRAASSGSRSEQGRASGKRSSAQRSSASPTAEPRTPTRQTPTRQTPARQTPAPRTSAHAPAARGQRPSGASGGYPGDFTGRPAIRYAPHEDGRPDPGEVVWTWVPYEEDHAQGKDRPVLVVGTDGRWLLGLQLTSKDHDLDEAQEASQGRYWMDIGSGAWDREGRASEVRLNRIIRIDPATVRRTAGRLDERRFTEVARGVLQYY